MAIKIVTGATGSAHVTSADDRGLNMGLAGKASYVLNVGNKFSQLVVSNNLIRISDGELLIQGCHARIEPGSSEDCVIDNGSADKKRVDLIVARYHFDSATGHETVTMEVIKGTEGSSYVTPSYNTGDIRTGSHTVDFPLYKVNINGINIASVTEMFMVAWPTTVFVCSEQVWNDQKSNYPDAFFVIKGQ